MRLQNRLGCVFLDCQGVPTATGDSACPASCCSREPHSPDLRHDGASRRSRLVEGRSGSRQKGCGAGRRSSSVWLATLGHESDGRWVCYHAVTRAGRMGSVRADVIGRCDADGGLGARGHGNQSCDEEATGRWPRSERHPQSPSAHFCTSFLHACRRSWGPRQTRRVSSLGARVEQSTAYSVPTGFAAPAVDLDTAALEKTLRAKGTANGGVYQFGIPRAEAITEGGVAVPPPMGTGTAINFQPTGSGKAAITGRLRSAR
jgi:hypothetical protein